MRRLSPSLVISVLALVVALGGVSYAAVTLPKNSVGTAQLKKNAVISTKVKNDSLTGADVKESTLKLPKKRGALRLTGADLRPVNDLQTYTLSGSRMILTNGAAVMVAPLHLPDGAVITKLTGVGVDNTEFGGVQVSVIRTDNNGVSDVAYGGSTAGYTSSPDAQSFPVNTPGAGAGPVDNDAFGYWVNVDIGENNLAFDSLLVEYTY